VAREATTPTIIRAQLAGDRATVRMLMAHEMESGQRKDSAGQTVPAWHIQQVLATLNGRMVFSAQWGPGMAKNPYLQFSLRGAKAGDKLALRWQDNRGASRSDEITLA
jgi:sulfur-oxidizing protein SoxZ